MNPVEQLAIQTCYTRAKFIAAHLRKYFEDCAIDSAALPESLLDYADSIVLVLDQMRPQPAAAPEIAPPSPFLDGMTHVVTGECDACRGHYQLRLAGGALYCEGCYDIVRSDFEPIDEPPDPDARDRTPYNGTWVGRGPEDREFIEGYDDVPDEDHGAGRIGR